MEQTDQEHRLLAYLDSEGWNGEEVESVMRYIGHHVMSSEGVLVVYHHRDAVHARKDAEMAAQARPDTAWDSTMLQARVDLETRPGM